MEDAADLTVLSRKIFRDGETAAKILKIINAYWKDLNSQGVDHVKIMNFCGTHEWTTAHYGIRSVLPEGVELIAGPGCPVCVTPSFYVEAAVKLALEGLTVYTFGDAYKLPAVRKVDGCGSLSDAKMMGCDVKVVYSFLDAVKSAAEEGRPSIFLGVGFETTFPGYAAAVQRDDFPKNLTVISAGRLTPPAAKFAVEKVGTVSGVIAPGHVSTVVGAGAWSFLPRDFGIPAVVAGFEPLDVLMAIAVILNMILNSQPDVVVEYSRAVSWNGNSRALKTIAEVFEVGKASWRGIGFIDDSGLFFREKYAWADALASHGLKEPSEAEWRYDLLPGCRCGHVILGMAKPSDCKFFMKECTPLNPYGPCMVSGEGACAIWARTGGEREDFREWR
ncbi:MAG: hydrogenase formation protein HypD [Candidatus Caldarchaeum sp.]|nr:hydrogenase formation protein HypD [Candidatus Caldarchaeum sp.]MDW8436157.1 hydrogenase formation protein HypD [Candidatus Caldarchaeum sp.]